MSAVPHISSPVRARSNTFTALKIDLQAHQSFAMHVRQRVPRMTCTAAGMYTPWASGLANADAARSSAHRTRQEDFMTKKCNVGEVLKISGNGVSKCAQGCRQYITLTGGTTAYDSSVYDKESK